MKRIYFLRHLQTEKGMGNHGTLPLNTLQDLATQVIDPYIDESMFYQAEAFLAKEEIKRIDYILHSSIKRAKQTAGLLAKKFHLSTSKIQESEALNEIVFEPRKLITQNEWEKEGMRRLRVAVYEGSLTGDGAEHVEQIYRRIRQVEKEIEDTSAITILCVTHAFFMRYLELYFMKKKTNAKDISLHDIMSASIYNYGTGFGVYL